MKIITSSPSPIWVNNSVQELRIRCVASGFPYPTFTWEKDGKVIENCQIHEECAKTKRYLLTSYGLKIVQPRYPDDNGKFSCLARNNLGTDRRDFDVIIPGRFWLCSVTQFSKGEPFALWSLTANHPLRNQRGEIRGHQSISVHCTSVAHQLWLKSQIGTFYFLRPSPYVFIYRWMLFLILGQSAGLRTKKITWIVGIGGLVPPYHCCRAWEQQDMK